MLKQAVRILMDNAAKYSPAGSRVTLRTYREPGHVCIDVQDNGIGVSPEDARRMFDRFYRADAARNSETGGSGLGLSIAKWIVGRHGGSFRVKSYEDIGTCITIVLPETGPRAAARETAYSIPASAARE
jgi:signal transduction histidine kinase